MTPVRLSHAIGYGPHWEGLAASCHRGDVDATTAPDAGAPSSAEATSSAGAVNHAAVLSDAAATAAALRLRDPLHRVSRRAIGYWALRAGLGWLVPLVIEVVWLVADRGTSSPTWSG